MDNFQLAVLCGPYPSTLSASQGQAMGSIWATEAQSSQGPCPTSLNLPLFCSWGFSGQTFAQIFGGSPRCSAVSASYGHVFWGFRLSK